jgi:polyribonucleotide nucleotidyltransferase
LKVPKEKIGLVIGKGGETIKYIQGECNVTLKIDPHVDQNDERPVTITGTTEAIAMAKEHIFERVLGRKGLDLGVGYDPTVGMQDTAYAAAYGGGVPSATAYTQQAYDASGKSPLL